MTAPLLADLIERMTGLALDRGGVSSALDRFVSDRMRALGLTMIESYVSLAADARGPEQRRLIDAITVPHTWFYRDQEQLHVIARLLVAAPAGPISVWVAGCATGEEAYTLAMIGRRIGREVHVLATDVNENALAAANHGVYSTLAIRDVPELERRWLIQRENQFEVDRQLRAAVTFQRHNLVDPPPIAPRGAWDLVVCRNVLIYFAPHAAARLLGRFARAVREGGSVVVGASEVVFEPPAGLELISSGNRLVLRRPPHPVPPRRERMPPLRPPSLSDLVPPVSELVARSEPPRPVVPAAPVAPAVPAPVAPGGPGAPIASDDLVTQLDRGHALFERGEIAAALEVYHQLSRAHPAVAEVYLFLGIARYAHGEVEDAATALRASLCLNAALWPAGFFLARAYERLGRRADAVQQYDLVAVDDLQPLELRSTSAVINELRALRHDFRNAARRLSVDRTTPPRRFPR